MLSQGRNEMTGYITGAIFIDSSKCYPVFGYPRILQQQLFLRNTKLPQADTHMTKEHNKLSQRLMGD